MDSSKMKLLKTITDFTRGSTSPRPSPPGEGETFAVCLKNRTTELAGRSLEKTKRRDAIPSPIGWERVRASLFTRPSGTYETSFNQSAFTMVEIAIALGV